jgi:DNA-binding MarR family transcriptional regulator/predicted GNAT family acetyltransferase
MDIIQSLGPLAIASRLKRLSDRLLKDAALIYEGESLAFEPRWFPVFYLLWQKAPIGVTEISRELGVTHPAVNQVAGDLENAGLLVSGRDKEDDRRRLLSLSQKGKELITRLVPVWRDIEEASRDLLDSQAPGLLGDLDRVESALDEKEMSQRIRDLLKHRQQEAVEILDYEPRYKAAFKRLNLEWLERYFEVEPVDERILSDPQGQVLKRGGKILFARLDGEIVGTAALIPREEGTAELTKLAVAEKARGRQAGKKLVLAAIERARALGARTLQLHTNPKLVAANQLFRQLDFSQVTPAPRKDLGYKRPSILMTLALEDNIP